jgi:hypothetical protein
MNSFSPLHKTNRGVALIAVLAILTILALLAAAFTAFMHISSEIGKRNTGKVQSDMLAHSALEHAVSIIVNDLKEQPAWDDCSESWTTCFTPSADTDEMVVNIDGLPKNVSGCPPRSSRWIYVKNNKGELVGRYAVLVEDEAGKININTATALSPAMQNQGVGTFEVMLTDGESRGLPIPIKMAQKIVDYRYGLDKQPGQAMRDDNLTEAKYLTDEIDNNANWVFDEDGEGLDEPEEYFSSNPVWDDRAFQSIDEMCDVCSPRRSLAPKARKLLRRFSTVYSRGSDVFWDARSGSWQKKVNVNVADRNQIKRVLRRANQEMQFEQSSSSLRQLVSNIIDYRDENHALSTVGSDYGVEAVSFNEIMAHDMSMTFLAHWHNGSWVPVYGFSPNSARMYYPEGVWMESDYPKGFWKVTSIKKSGNDFVVTLDIPSQPFSSGGRKDIEDGQKAYYTMELPWEANFFNGNQAFLFEGSATVKGEYTVIQSFAGNDRRLLIKPRNSSARDFANSATNKNNITFRMRNTWVGGFSGVFATEPQRHVKCFFPVELRALSKDYYYRCYLNDTMAMDTDTVELDLDGDINSYSEVKAEKKTFVYKRGQPLRANQYGFVEITVTSPQDAKSSNAVDIDNILFKRPDVVELINVSDSPISLRNWRVVMNTGVSAETLATIDKARYYSDIRAGRYDDPNPVIPAGGYFYLTNDRGLFAREYCSGNPTYGDSKMENIPVYELPDRSWGITYPIVEVIPPYSLKVDGAYWRPDQLKNEIIMILADRSKGQYNPDGIIETIHRNTRDVLSKGSGWQWEEHKKVKPGDRVMVLGLPRQGGFVSFTLKNEYNQITARTTTYGSVDEEEVGYSTEKADPTHYTWVKIKEPTIGGDERLARNRSTYRAEYTRPHIKNNYYTSVAEMQKVRKADDWENLGTTRGKETTRALKVLSRYFTTTGIRLDAEEDEVHLFGWQPAFGAATASGINIVNTEDSRWDPGIWIGQKITLLTGDLKGEEFIITNSTRDSLLIDGYSTKNRKTMYIKEGDRFNIGPGYGTSMFYTRNSNEEGVWEWKNKQLQKSTYGLYIFGLNDSIKTTEFLEENWNSDLSVAIYNYSTEQFEELPLRDAVNQVEEFITTRGSTRLQYDKSDGIYCGIIRPAHISENGGIKMKLTAHNLEHEDCSGFAWFDCVYLTPGVADGRININTASERVLTSLRGINAELAQKITAGLDGYGRKALKPYKHISDILDVNGFKTEMYGSICNLITTRSDQYRVVVVAQALKDVNNDGRYSDNSGDRIISETRADVIVDRSQLTDGDPDTNLVRVFK